AAEVRHLADARVGQAGGDPRLGAEPLARGRLGHLRRVQQLHRDRPVQDGVGGAPHGAHPARADLLVELVPAAEQIAGRPAALLGGAGVVVGHWSITASMMRLAMGAASVPPLPPPCSTTTATATWGSSAGAKETNQLCVGPLSVSAVPVLPATCMPGMAPPGPEASAPSVTRIIIWVRSSAVFALTAVLSVSGVCPSISDR